MPPKQKSQEKGIHTSVCVSTSVSPDYSIAYTPLATGTVGQASRPRYTIRKYKRGSHLATRVVQGPYPDPGLKKGKASASLTLLAHVSTGVVVRDNYTNSQLAMGTADEIA